ncbi:MAG: helix-turn-helix domain-containing protein [Rhodospirillaceae bacterium]|nr:helix-turn-helix domain-containing protein [Rhodospirillaceae bacterium]
MSEAGSRILESANQALSIARGEANSDSCRVHVLEDIDVSAIRRKTGLTQAAFAERYGLSAGTVRDWEQKRREPAGSARVLLRVIDREPEAVDRALAVA